MLTTSVLLLLMTMRLLTNALPTSLLLHVLVMIMIIMVIVIVNIIIALRQFCRRRHEHLQATICEAYRHKQTLRHMHPLSLPRLLLPLA